MIRSPLVATALVALAGSAMAQTASSNVTLFGIIDTNFTYGSGSLTKQRGIGTGGLAGSRLGVRGAEDLGDGWRASFVIEHGFTSDIGTAAAVFWNRQVLVGLGRNTLGEVQLGRIYTPTFIVHATYDAFGPQGPAAQQVLLGSMEAVQPAAIRANNAINYTTPANLGGFSLQAMRSLTEGTGNKYAGLRVGYAGGPFAVDLALGDYDNAGIGDLKSVTLGGRYKLGNLTMFALFDRANSGTSFDTRGMQVSVAYQLGATELKASVAESERKNALGAAAGTTRRYGVGAVYNLSRRTALYTSLARVNNANGATTALNGSTTAANKGSTGMDVGIRHAF